MYTIKLFALSALTLFIGAANAMFAPSCTAVHWPLMIFGAPCPCDHVRYEKRTRMCEIQDCQEKPLNYVSSLPTRRCWPGLVVN